MYMKMSIAADLKRVVTLRLYTSLIFLIASFILGSITSWMHCKENNSLEFNQKVETRVILLEPSRSDDPQKCERKTILYWTMMFGSKNFYLGEGDIFEGCPVRSCMGTNDRKYQSVDKFDAIMFHGPQLDAKDLPENRSSHQRYIFMNLETPVFHPVPETQMFNNFFNWTMTYRRDSDIMRPYGIFTNITSKQVIPPHITAQWVNVSGSVVIPESMRLLFRTKTKIAAWFVSHCETNSMREKVAEKLQEHARVDIYGDCGKFECPRTKEAECYEKLESEYFFYLSFENSMCRDYLTEKVYKALEYGVIPVVYGAADYQSFLPPNSYISVLDFPSIKELAEFLVNLSQDEERYLSYFRWKFFYSQVDRNAYISCELCKALYDKNLPNQVIGDIHKWWTEKSECKSPPKIS